MLKHNGMASIKFEGQRMEWEESTEIDLTRTECKKRVVM